MKLTRNSFRPRRRATAADRGWVNKRFHSRLAFTFAGSAEWRYRFQAKLLAEAIYKHLTFRVNCNRAGGKKRGIIASEPVVSPRVEAKEIREGQASFYQRQLLRFSHRLTQVVSVPLRLGDGAPGCQEVTRKLDGKLSSLALPPSHRFVSPSRTLPPLPLRNCLRRTSYP